MALTNVRVEYHADVTINLGNFENFKPGYTLSADIEDGDNPNEARAKLKATVRRWLEEDIEEAKED